MKTDFYAATSALETGFHAGIGRNADGNNLQKPTSAQQQERGGVWPGGDMTLGGRRPATPPGPGDVISWLGLLPTADGWLGTGSLS